MINLKANAVKFTFTLLEEDSEVGESIEDKETVVWIRNQLANGQEYAWFCAKVTASLPVNLDDLNRIPEADVLSYDLYLGGLSYESKEAFLASVDFKDMCSEALACLNEKVNSVFKEFQDLDRETNL